MHDPEDRIVETFGQNISGQPLRLLSADGGKQKVVGQSEPIPCHADQLLWRGRLGNRRVVLYIDNGAARFCFINGTPQGTVRKTMHVFHVVRQTW